MNASLYRSREDVIIGGVCGGLGAFLGVHPAYVRLFFIILIFGKGIGVLLYLLFWIIIPLDGQVQRNGLALKLQNSSYEIAKQTKAAREDMHRLMREPQTQLGILIGAAFILVGILYLISSLNLNRLTWLSFDLFWPILMIFGGLAILLRRPKGV